MLELLAQAVGSLQAAAAKLDKSPAGPLLLQQVCASPTACLIKDGAPVMQTGTEAQMFSRRS